MIAYVLFHAGAAPGIGLLINLLIYALIAWLVYSIAVWAGLPAQICRVVVAIIALILILSLFTGCAGSGEGGSWTPQDTAAVSGAITNGAQAYDQIRNPQYYRPYQVR